MHHYVFSILDDIWPKNDRQEDESEPDWVKSEREQFSQHRDTNKDGKLDKVCKETRASGISSNVLLIEGIGELDSS